MSEYRVRIADYAVGRAGDEMITLGLGSCVAIILHDAGARVGGLAHCLLPDAEGARDADNPAKFPGSIVPVMVAELRGLGGAPNALVAKLVGGASMFKTLIENPMMNVGERNIVAARDALTRAGIRIGGEDVGGESGRSVRFAIADGSVHVRTVRGGERVL